MLTVLSVEQAGSKDAIEFFTSSPEGYDLSDMISFFHAKHQTWELITATDDEVLFRDSQGNYWVGQSVVYDHTCEVYHYSDRS